MRKYVLWFAAIAYLGAAALWLHGFHRPPPITYWQRQAAMLKVGMTRAEAEKFLPRQNFDGVLRRLEDWRLLHARYLPPIKEALEFHMAHSNFGNLMGYEVSKGVFVNISYDLAGLAPGPPSTGKSAVNPGDRVTVAPVVTDTTTGLAVWPWNTATMRPTVFVK